MKPGLATAATPIAPALPRAAVAVVAMVVFAIGVGLRARGLSTFSISGDEIYSIWEARSACKTADALEPMRAWQLRLDLMTARNPAEPPGIDKREAWRLRWAYRTNPLHVLLTEASFRLLGDSPLAARFAPFLCGIAAMVVLPVMLSRVAGARAGFVLFALLALCPEHVEISHFARYQSASFLFGGIMLLACMIQARSPSLRMELLVLVAGVALVACHATGLLVAVTIVLCGALLLRSRLLLTLLPLAAIAAVVAFSFGAQQKVWDVIKKGIPRHELANPSWRIAFSLAYSIGALAVVFAIVQAWRILRRGDRAGRIVLLVAVLPSAAFLVMAHVKDVGSRYFSAIEPAWLVLAALGLEPLLARAPPAMARAGTAAVAALFLLQVPCLASNWVDGQRYDFAGVAELLRARVQPQDRIVSDSSGILEYHLRTHEVDELPGTLKAVEQKLLSGDEHRAFVVMCLQRGLYVWPGHLDNLRSWINENARVVETVGRSRIDAPLYRFEMQILEVDLDHLRTRHHNK